MARFYEKLLATVTGLGGKVAGTLHDGHAKTTAKMYVPNTVEGSRVTTGGIDGSGEIGNNVVKEPTADAGNG